MRPIRVLFARIRALVRRDGIAHEIRDELQFHLDMRIAEHRARGLSESDATRLARRRFGNPVVVADQGYDIRGAGIIETIWQDVRWAARQLRRDRGTTAVTYGVLALTMAAATITFSVVDVVALRPLPFGDPDRLVGITLPGSAPSGLRPPAPQDYFALVEGTSSFAGIGAARFVAPRELATGGRIATLTTRAVSSNLFDVLGVQPALGRFFDVAHERPGGPAGAVISHELWVRVFGSDPSVLGRRLELHMAPDYALHDSRTPDSRTIIGVLPPDVRFPIMLGDGADLYVPWVPTPAERAVGGPRLGTIAIAARLRDGLTVEQARADVSTNGSYVVVPLHEQVVGAYGPQLVLILAAVGLVLAVACVNVGTLLLARATARTHEFSTRQALGAPRARLVRGLLIESLLLALAATATGVVLAVWGVEAARAVLPPDLPRATRIAVDARVVLVSGMAAIACSLIFGSAPAWRAARPDLLPLIASNAAGSIAGGRQTKVLGAFLTGSVALTSALLVATVLSVATFARLELADLGFDRRDLVSVGYIAPIGSHAAADREAVATTLRESVLASVRAVPGVIEAASHNGATPLGGTQVRYSIVLPGGREITVEDAPQTMEVSGDYFATVRITPLAGRLFDVSDGPGAPPVIIVNDVAARAYFPGTNPIGQTITIYEGPRTVVGIVPGISLDGPEAELRPQVYTPFEQLPGRGILRSNPPRAVGHIIIRTAGPPRQFSESIEEAISAALPGASLTTRLMDDRWHLTTAARRFNAFVLATFGLVAVAIAGVGIYGTTAFTVVRQTRTIGLRTALGATPGQIVRKVLGGSLFSVGVGAALGLGSAWLGSRAFASLVYGIEPATPSVYVGVGMFLIVVALTAAWIPARKAAKIDPMVALRAE